MGEKLQKCYRKEDMRLKSFNIFSKYSIFKFLYTTIFK